MKVKTALLAGMTALLPATQAFAHPGSHDHMGAASIVAHLASSPLHLAGLIGWFVALGAIVYLAKRRIVNAAGRRAEKVAVRMPARTGQE